MKKKTCNLLLLVTLILCITFSVIVYKNYNPEKENKVSYVLSPSHDYVDYDPMENVSDSLAMYLQELRYSRKGAKNN